MKVDREVKFFRFKSLRIRRGEYYFMPRGYRLLYRKFFRLFFEEDIVNSISMLEYFNSIWFIVDYPFLGHLDYVIKIGKDVSEDEIILAIDSLSSLFKSSKISAQPEYGRFLNELIQIFESGSIKSRHSSALDMLKRAMEVLMVAEV